MVATVIGEVGASAAKHVEEDSAPKAAHAQIHLLYMADRIAPVWGQTQWMKDATARIAQVRLKYKWISTG